MTIEATLLSIDSKLGAILTAINAGAPIDAVATGETAAELAGLAPAQPAGEAPKPKRGRPAKTETAAAPAATTPTAPAVSSAADFLSLEAPAAVAEKQYTLDEVRAALAVVQARDGMPKALQLFKDATGLDTIQKLTADKYGAVFKAALPSGKIAIEDVRAVLVAANERVANSGLKVLNDNGAKTIVDVTVDKYVKVILDAHKVQ